MTASAAEQCPLCLRPEADGFAYLLDRPLVVQVAGRQVELPAGPYGLCTPCSMFSGLIEDRGLRLPTFMVAALSAQIGMADLARSDEDQAEAYALVEEGVRAFVTALLPYQINGRHPASQMHPTTEENN